MLAWITTCTAKSMLHITSFSAFVPTHDVFSKTDPFVSSAVFTEGGRHITLVPPWGVKNNDNHPTWQLPWNVTLPFREPAVDFFIEDEDNLYNDVVATLHFQLAQNLNYAEASDGETRGFLSYTLVAKQTPSPTPALNSHETQETHTQTQLALTSAGISLGVAFCLFLIYVIKRYRMYYVPHISEAEVFRPPSQELVSTNQATPSKCISPSLSHASSSN